MKHCRSACHIFLLAAALCLVGCGGPTVSPTDQTLIREADLLHARLEPAVVEVQNTRLKRYFEQLGARIVTAAKELDEQGAIKSRGGGSNAWMFDRNIDFHLVDSDLPNSFTGGGRHIYVYNGLFQQCRNEDELAAVFCHEYAHVYARHVQQHLKRDPSLSGDEALLFPFATLRPSPAQDRAADSIAFAIYAKGGWDPARFGGVYERMLSEQAPPGVDRAIVSEKASAAGRFAPGLPPAARDWAQPPVADDASFAQLQAQAKTPGSQRNDRAELLLAAFPNCLTAGDTPVQARARERLFPPPAAGSSENKWGKGLPGR